MTASVQPQTATVKLTHFHNDRIIWVTCNDINLGYASRQIACAQMAAVEANGSHMLIVTLNTDVSDDIVKNQIKGVIKRSYRAVAMTFVDAAPPVGIPAVGAIPRPAAPAS